MDDAHVCVACGATARFSILLASQSGDRSGAIPATRYYLPNQMVREAGAHNEVWFCLDCMRALEDSFRATILYLQSENGLLGSAANT